ncbi:MAG: LLM class flavin-dependent oxidoreductase, partial [Rhizobiales bacterium]|nr:LLM class flavin-dependent oxidoreductase [Hyphomicrobiales bacterium]
EGSREKFDESLNVLMVLLSREEVSWNGKFYNFEPLTIMPRPLSEPMPQIVMSALIPEAIYHSTLRGFHIQTTPLQGDMNKMLEQVDAFKRGKTELGAAGEHLTVSLSRVAFVVRNERERRAKLELAYDYYSRFDNVSTGPGLVSHGAVEPLPRNQTIEQLDENLLICTPEQMVDKLGPYADAGIDEIIFNMNIGTTQSETLDAMQCISEEVMPHFDDRRRSKVA